MFDWVLNKAPEINNNSHQHAISWRLSDVFIAKQMHEKTF